MANQRDLGYLEVTEFLTSCGYADYAERFVELGFDSWQSVELMDRDDLLACGVKLGHVKVNSRSHSLLGNCYESV